MGKVGEVPDKEYFIYQAAKGLGMSYYELEQHPERERLMTLEFSISHGESEGDFARQQTKQFWVQVKAREDAIAKVRDPIMNKK